MIILLNGPPRSGKDTIGLMLYSKFNCCNHRVEMMKMADPVKHGTHNAYGIYNVPADHYESVKDKPHKDFFDKTPREAYIEFSEVMIKPTLGECFFAKVCANRIRKFKKRSNGVIIITDVGFDVELETLVNEFGKEELVIINTCKKGCDFSNDSRQYVLGNGENCSVFYGVENDESLTILEASIERIGNEMIENFSLCNC